MTAKNKALREGVKIMFADGDEREVYPLTIRQLRKFMAAVKNLKVDESEMTDDDIDQMMEAAAIALAKDYPDLASDVEALEDILDIRCFNQLLAAAMGADPNG